MEINGKKSALEKIRAAMPVVVPTKDGLVAMIPKAPENPIVSRYNEKVARESTNKYLYNLSKSVDWQKVSDNWRYSNVPPRQAAIKTEFHSHRMWNEYFDMVKNRSGSGFIVAALGRRGTGKTQLASCLIRFFCEYGQPCLYTTAMQIFLDIKSTYGGKGEKSEKDVINSLRNYQLLIIDEFQERGETDWEDRILTHIVDLRYRDVRDTMLIANMDAKQFEQSAGASISSRMNETGGILNFDWESFR